MKRVFLATQSPRRRELLNQIGVSYELLNVSVDESPLGAHEAPAQLVERLALAKAKAGHALLLAEGRLHAGFAVLGADTVVVCDAQTMGKPLDADDASRMLERLSGRAHQVMTGVALVTAAGAASAINISEVHFRTISAEERRRYCASGEPLDKAGGYGIQGLAGIFITELHGSYSGVMGLPLCETAALLERASIPVLRLG